MKPTRTEVRAIGVDQGALHVGQNSPARGEKPMRNRRDNAQYIHVLSSDGKTIAIPARYAATIAAYTLTEETTESGLWLQLPGSFVVAR